MKLIRIVFTWDFYGFDFDVIHGTSSRIDFVCLIVTIFVVNFMILAQPGKAVFIENIMNLRRV